jgi:hypothetical protein
MVWLEIIEIRAVGNNRELLELQLQDLINDVNQDASLQAIKMYRHVLLDTDLCIHLFRD